MYKKYKTNIIQLVISILQIVLLFFTSYNLVSAQAGPNNILAKVGNKTITVEDFKYRSELTIRPKNFKNNITILNNLIIEKLVASEAKKNIQLADQSSIRAQLKGIKEQLMRDKLFESVSNKVKIDSNDVSKIYKLSSRAYQVEYYTINNDQIAKNISDYISLNPDSTESIINLLGDELGRQPERIIKFDDPESDIIHDAIFSDMLEKNDLIGPLKLASNNHLIMKVLDWVEYPAIGYHDQMKKYKEVEEKVIKKKVNKEWGKYQADILKNKKVEFNPGTFNLLSSIAYKDYNSSSVDDSLNVPLKILSNSEINEVPNDLFFTIDNTEWSVDDFRNAMASHPLVFRSKELTVNNFKKEFKFAIIDLIHDHYITNEAYKHSLDKDLEILKKVEDWEDSFLSVQFGKTILEDAKQKELFNVESNTSKKNYWKKYIDELCLSYSNEVYVNYDLLDQINTTNIEYFIYRPGVPYPVPVPSFPTFTEAKNRKFNQTIKK